jgi:HEAT repeat protein
MRTDLLHTLATNFGSQSVRCAKAIREIYLLDPVAFPPMVLEVLGSAPDSPGAQFLVALLASQPDWLRNVCDPEKHTLDQSHDLVRRTHKVDSLAVLKLADILAQPASSTDAEARFAARVFAVLKESPPPVALPALRQLSRCPNARVRSKAVLLMGRIYQNPKFVDRGALEQDPRVAANAVESLWGLTDSSAREAFVSAALDPHHRVSANGIVGLYLMGDECSIPFLFNLSTSEKSLARAAAAWAMGRLEDPRFLPRLARLRDESDPLIRQGAFRSIARIRQRMTQLGAAGALSVQLRDVECRAGIHRVSVVVTKDEQLVPDLDTRQFVVWNGPDLVEEFSASLRAGADPYYEIAFEGAPSPTNLVKVQVSAQSGVGEDTGPETAFD